MLLWAGFRIEYPGGGIYRHQLEQMTGNAVMNIVFKYIAIFIFIEAFIWLCIDMLSPILVFSVLNDSLHFSQTTTNSWTIFVVGIFS